MKENKVISELISEIQSSKETLTKIDEFYDKFINNELKQIGKNTFTAIVMAEILVDFYTCLETLFIKISQFYENNLQRDKWHSELLHKMTLEIEDIRPAVITKETCFILQEIMKFRHFKRYYFEFNYDWDKLEFLEKEYNKVKELLDKDLNNFKNILKDLG